MTQPKADASSVLVLTESIAAPPEAIFAFLVDPQKMVRWMGTAADIEPEPGGTFWLNVNGTDIASGTYLEVDPPNRVVFTWGWEGSAEVPPGSSTVTFSLTPAGPETVVELRHEGLPGGAADDHGEGWRYFFTRLVAVSLGQDPGPSQFD